MREGTYYANIDEVWGPENVTWDKAKFKEAFERLRRNRTPDFVERQKGTLTVPKLKRTVNKKRKASEAGLTQHDEEAVSEAVRSVKAASQPEPPRAYHLTIEQALLPTTKVADAVGSAHTSHSGTATKTTVWPTDIFGRSKSKAHIAHIVPAGPNLASLYVDVAICAFPLPDKNNKDDEEVEGKDDEDEDEEKDDEEKDDEEVEDDEEAKDDLEVEDDEEAKDDLEVEDDEEMDDDEEEAKDDLEVEDDEEGDDDEEAKDDLEVEDDDEEYNKEVEDDENEVVEDEGEGKEEGEDTVDEAEACETVQKAIHGSKKSKKKYRTPSTGIKHLVANKIRLADQADYFDKNPCVLIAPVMTPQEMLDWKGGGYSAIVMAGGISKRIEKKTRNLTVKLKETPIADVCSCIGMSSMVKGVPHKTANKDQVDMARELLHGVVTGMAYSLRQRLKRMDKYFDKKKHQQKKKNLENLLEDFKKGTKRGIVHPSRKTYTKPVRLVHFSSHSETSGHPAPDPLLLAVRAAITWSWRQGQKLLVESKEYDDDDVDELDQLGMEEFLEYQRELQRPPDSLEKLARSLGQPYGFQEDSRIPLRGH